MGQEVERLFGHHKKTFKKRDKWVLFAQCGLCGLPFTILFIKDYLSFHQLIGR